MTLAALGGAGGGCSPAANDSGKLVVVGLTTLVGLLLFNRFSSIDATVSREFYDPLACALFDGNRHCSPFPAKSIVGLRMLRNALQYFQLFMAIGLAAHLGMRFAQGARIGNSGMAGAVAAVGSYLLGVGVLVNLILKEFWGRPRPVQTDIFGGNWPFVPAGEIASYCQSNCSFVSGEAAGAFWLLCLATLLPPRFRFAGLVAAFFIACLTAGLRVAFGMHYLSDVVLSGLLMMLTFLMLRLLAARAARSVPRSTAAALVG